MRLALDDPVRLALDDAVCDALGLDGERVGDHPPQPWPPSRR